MEIEAHEELFGLHHAAPLHQKPPAEILAAVFEEWGELSPPPSLTHCLGDGDDRVDPDTRLRLRLGEDVRYFTLVDLEEMLRTTHSLLVTHHQNRNPQPSQP